LGCDQCFIDHEHGSKNISTFRDFPIFLDKIKILTDEIEKEIAQIDDQSDQIEDKKIEVNNHFSIVLKNKLDDLKAQTLNEYDVVVKHKEEEYMKSPEDNLKRLNEFKKVIEEAGSDTEKIKTSIQAYVENLYDYNDDLAIFNEDADLIKDEIKLYMDYLLKKRNEELLKIKLPRVIMDPKIGADQDRTLKIEYKETKTQIIEINLRP